MHITIWKKPVWKSCILYDSNYTCSGGIINLSKLIECITPRVNHNVNYRLRLWHVSVGSSVTKIMPLWGEMLIMVEVMHVWGQGVYGKSPYLPLKFTVNLKKYSQLKNNNLITVLYFFLILTYLVKMSALAHCCFRLCES